MDVLDIGSNCGFIDMTVAPHVKSITGLEYDNDYVVFANKAAEILGLGNVKFFQADFNEWIKHNTQRYGAIFSFAVYHHIGIPPEKNAEILSELLLPGGVLVFESHPLALQEGQEFYAYREALLEHGFTEHHSGSVENGGRVFAVLRKD